MGLNKRGSFRRAELGRLLEHEVRCAPCLCDLTWGGIGAPSTVMQLLVAISLCRCLSERLR